MRSNGNPFLSRPQTADGGSNGAKLSKPFPKSQLKSLKPARYWGSHPPECSKHVPHLQCTLTEWQCETSYTML